MSFGGGDFLFSYLFFHIGIAFMLYAHLYVHITIPTYFVTVIHLLCYFMLRAFVTYSIKLLLLLLLVPITYLNSTTMFSPAECGTTWSVCGRGLNENRSL